MHPAASVQVCNHSLFIMLTCPTSVNLMTALLSPGFIEDASPQKWYLFVSFIMCEGCLAGLTPSRSAVQLLVHAPLAM